MNPQPARGRVTGERDFILSAIREALSTPTNPHVQHAPLSPDRSSYSAGLPTVEDTWDAKLATFQSRCEALRATLIVVDDITAMTEAVQAIVQQESADRVGCHQNPLVMAVAQALRCERVNVDDGFDAARLETCPVGISGCYALIAQTGSVMVTSASSGGRALSVLPPLHVVLATADQLITDLPTAFAQFEADPSRDVTSMLSFISGPSRTGDIERILVLGAHGPKRLTIVLAMNAPSF